MRKGLLGLLPLVLLLVSCRTGVTMWTPCSPGSDPTGTDGSYAMVCQDGRWEPVLTNNEFIAINRGRLVTIAPLPLDRPVPTILSASWGTDDAVGCPSGEHGLDNIPVTFNWFIRLASIEPTDFRVVRSDGSVSMPTCALQFPPDESDEGQTVNLIGDFGDSVNGPTPSSIRIVGTLEGRAPGSSAWSDLQQLPAVAVEPLSGGPFIVDAWTLMPSIYDGDANRCTVGSTFVRVMWSNGLTAHPTGAEVGASVTASYRAFYRLPNGTNRAVAPLAVADLQDHSTAANADNMHDLCLAQPPDGSQLASVTIGGGLIQDPNGDPNLAQNFPATVT